MEYVTFRGRDYARIPAVARAVGKSEATLYNWRKAGFIEIEWPLGPAMAFVSRETVERLLRLKITAEMGAFVRAEDISHGTYSRH